MDSTIGNIHKFLGGHRGRLYQLGVSNKGWKPRFFVLERRRIKIYSDETLFRINGEVAISENTVVYDVPGENDGRKYLFYVYSRDAVTVDDVLFLSAQSRRDKMEWMEAIMDSVHNGFKLVNQPELWLDAFYPKVDVMVSYGMISVEYGNMLKPQMVEQTPTISLRIADPNAVYSMVMIDLDSIHASETNKTVFLHWGIVNIQGGDVVSGTEVAPYWSPAPEYDSGLHRYFFLVFTQNFILTASQIAETSEAFQQRERFSYLDWIRGRNLGEPVGLNGFYAGWEEYCGTIHERQGYAPLEGYLLSRQDQFLQKEAEAIWVEDSKMQLFQDLSLADLFPENADISATPMGSIAMLVRYGQEAVGGGVAVNASAVIAPPQVVYTPHQAEISGFVAGTNAIAVDVGLYTLLMVDADAGLETRGAASGKAPQQERVHWVVLNIPQWNISEGVAVVPYVPPTPMHGTGLHRYVLCLYKQKKAFSPQQIDSSRAYFARSSLGLKSYDWVRSHSAVVLNVPVALEAFLCEWDESLAVADERSVSPPRNSEDEVYLSLPQFGSRSSASSVVSSSAGFRRGAAAAEREEATESEQESVEHSVAVKKASSQSRREVQQPPPTRVPPLQQKLGGDTRVAIPAQSRSVGSEGEGEENVDVDAPVQVASEGSQEAHRQEVPSQSERCDGSTLVSPPQSGRMVLVVDSETWQSPPKEDSSVAVEGDQPTENGSEYIAADDGNSEAPEASDEDGTEDRAHPEAPEAVGRTYYELQDQLSSPAQVLPEASVQPSLPPPAYEEPSPLSQEPQQSPSRSSQRDDGHSLGDSLPLSPQHELDNKEREEREKRERKKQLQRQREAELERFEAERAQEEQRRRETAQAEERRRLERLQAEEMDRVMEEKRRRARADQEKLRKQEEMRRAMQEHELAEAERVRQEEARAEEERQRALQEKVEEQRRLESKQAEELQRAQEEAAVEAERQRQVEERSAEDKRRLVQQRAAEEEEDRREQQRQADVRRFDQQQPRSPQANGTHAPHGDGRGQVSSPSRQQAVSHPVGPMGQIRSPPQPLAPAIKLRTSFGNVVVDSNRGLIEAPPSSRYGAGRSDSITDLHSGSDSNPDLHHGEFESESVLSALSSGTSVNSKMQRSVSFATVISTSDDSYWLDAEDTGSSGDREWRDRRLRKERERERERSRYMEQQMLESIESEEMRRVRMQELEEQRLREEAAEAKARQHRLRQEHQREVERLQLERAAAAEAARLQQKLQQQREQEEATMEFLRQEAEEEERRRLADEAEARRLQEEQDRQAALEAAQLQRRQEEKAEQAYQAYQEHLQLQLRMQQLAEEHSVQSSGDNSGHGHLAYEDSAENLGVQALDDDQDWGGYDDEHDDGLDMHVDQEVGEEVGQQLSYEVEEAVHEYDDHAVGAGTLEPGGHYDDYGEDDDAFGVQYDEELELGLAVAEERTPRSQLIDDHLAYFDNDRDEKATQDSNEPSAAASVMDADEEEDQKPLTPTPPTLPLTGLRSDEAELKSGSPNSSPGRSVPSTSASTISRSGTHTSGISGGHGVAPAGSITSRSFDLSDSESSGGRFLSPDARHSAECASAQSPPPPSPPALSTPTPPTPRSSKSLARGGKSAERLNVIAEGVNRARTSQDLCGVFEIATKSIFDGDRLKKRYSTDFMAKDSAVWIDPQKRSLHWGKKPLDAANSKFILLEPYSKANPNLPTHLRPLGENKGTCKAVQLVDATTFKVTLWSDEFFVGKLLGDNAAEKTNDWVKVVNSFQRR